MHKNDSPIHGIFRYSLPDDSIPAQDRCLYSFPSSKTVKDHSHALHDLRTSTDIRKDGAGLDIQGFVSVHHESALSTRDWFDERNVVDVYAPEMIKLICEVTGAKRAVIDGFALRIRACDEQEEDPYDVKLRGCALDTAVSKLPRNVIRVPGRDKANAIPPARTVHVDYSVKGLQDTVRWCRKDIVKAAKPAIDAEDAGETPRYAAYSIWRPLKPVKRDPLAVLDWRSVDRSEMAPIITRALSEVSETGEYMRTAYNHIPPKDPDALKWYWLPDQQPDEVLIVKFADTAAGELGAASDIAAHCVHGSPSVPDTEGQEARESIECRIIAFFD